jgi:hypothetical protein
MPTQPSPASGPGILLPAFEDGLGRRYRPVTRGADTPSEVLCFRHDLTDVPSFEFSLRERVASLAEFRHSYYARIRKVDRLSDELGTVALISDCAPGTRLAEILTAIEHGGPILSIDAALSLVRQLVPAMALLHDHVHVAHGAMGPERLIVTPQARVLIVEHVIGAALEQLKYSRERYWKELRIAVPMSVGLPRFDKRADLTQLGVVALSLIFGRPIQEDEYPASVEDLVATARARRSDGSREPLPAELRDWLRRTLQLDARHSFLSMSEAGAALEEILSEHSNYNASVSAVETFLASYEASTMPGAPRISRATSIAEPPSKRSEIRVPTPPPARIAYDEPAETTDADEWHPRMPYEPSAPRSARYKPIAIGLVLAIVAGGGMLVSRRFFSAAPVAATGVVTIDTNPSAGKVDVDGVDRGVAPLRLSLPVGSHVLTVRGEGEPRVIPLTINAGAEISQYVELPAARPSTGQIEIRTEPSGARVIVDNIVMGTTPMTASDLAPGAHTIKVESDRGTVSQTVTIEAGVTSSLVIPLAAAQTGPAPGWISVKAPFAMELFEQGRLVGNSSTDRIVLPPGKHDIEIANDAIGFRETRVVQVTPGKLAVIGITLPNGSLSVNATPWATVEVDGEGVGDTPIGNLSLSIGPHEVVFRNPQLGEHRRVVMVTERTPVRLSIDMTKR